MNYIVDDIGLVVQAMRTGVDQPPFYMYGHRAEISARLTEMDKDAVHKYNKYPLVALRMDIPELVKDGVYYYNLNIAILASTSPTDNAAERMEKVFKPILYPLYNRFFEKLRIAGLFMWPGNLLFPEHVKIDRPFWGTGYTEGSAGSKSGSTEQLFNDPLDAIEIVNLKINKEFNPC